MGKKRAVFRTDASLATVGSTKAERMRAEFEAQKARVEGLLARYERVVAELADLETDFRAMKLRIPRAEKRRPRRSRKGGLPDVLTRVLRGRTMGIEEAMEAVRRAGYESDSPYYGSRVRAALGREDLFVRVSRGRYRAKQVD